MPEAEVLDKAEELENEADVTDRQSSTQLPSRCRPSPPTAPASRALRVDLRSGTTSSGARCRRPEHNPVPRTAEACHTMKQFKERFHVQRSETDSHIPRDYGQFATGTLLQEFRDNATRVKRGQVAAKVAEAEAEAEDRPHPKSEAEAEVEAKLQP